MSIIFAETIKSEENAKKTTFWRFIDHQKMFKKHNTLCFWSFSKFFRKVDEKCVLSVFDIFRFLRKVDKMCVFLFFFDLFVDPNVV